MVNINTTLLYVQIAYNRVIALRASFVIDTEVSNR